MLMRILQRLFTKSSVTAVSPPNFERVKPSHSPCQICSGAAAYLDTVDLNKSCEEANGVMLENSGTPIDYYLCPQCGFCFAPEFQSWSFGDFEQFIYNDDYALVDPDYKAKRPDQMAQSIDDMFGAGKSSLRHVDYGGGSGRLSRMLTDKGWSSSVSYDPFVNVDVAVKDLGKFDLVTAIEVFEHVPNIASLMNDLRSLCKPDGLIFFTTLLSDGEISHEGPLTWWYASPRNGHISLFSAKSIVHCLKMNNLEMVSFTTNAHMAFQTLPGWASHLVKYE